MFKLRYASKQLFSVQFTPVSHSAYCLSMNPIVYNVLFVIALLLVHVVLKSLQISILSLLIIIISDMVMLSLIR
jgi:hypothetical protein